MKRAVFAFLAFGMLTADAQYQGRSGIRYMGQGTVFTVRRAGDWSPDRRDGRCTIRVRIDDDSDVELRGDQVRIRVLRGGPGRDEGSECNAPLPTGGRITNFRFRGIDGRGNPRLVQEPSNRNFFVAVVNVQDPQGGDEGYTFELTWQSDGFGGGGGGFPPPRPLPGGGGGLQDMNVSMAGFGDFDEGGQRHRLTDLSVRINGNQCSITMRSDRGQQLEMSGRVNRRQSSCNLNRSNRGRVNGTANITANGSRVSNVNLSGNMNGRNFNGNFRSR